MILGYSYGVGNRSSELGPRFRLCSRSSEWLLGERVCKLAVDPTSSLKALAMARTGRKCHSGG